MLLTLCELARKWWTHIFAQHFSAFSAESLEKPVGGKETGRPGSYVKSSFMRQLLNIGPRHPSLTDSIRFRVGVFKSGTAL